MPLPFGLDAFGLPTEMVAHVPFPAFPNISMIPIPASFSPFLPIFPGLAQISPFFFKKVLHKRSEYAKITTHGLLKARSIVKSIPGFIGRT